MLFVIDWRMAIVSLILVPVAVGIGLFIYKKVAGTQKKLDQTYANGF